MDAFGAKSTDGILRTAEYLDQSAFDEKFEIIPKDDYISNIYHINNKYQVPVLAGGFREMFQYCNEYLIYPDDTSYAALMDPDTLEERLASSETPGMIRAEFREKLIDGSYRWVQYIGIAGEEHGVPADHIYFYVYDIQNQKDRLEGKTPSMYALDTRDSVTGLRVREVFVPAAQKLTKSAPGPWCCVAIDIQHFKIFNAWFGYDKGNYLLCRIGNYLLNFEAREQAVTAYFGRDNFAVLMRHDPKKIDRIYADIRELVFTYSNMVGFLPAFGVLILDRDKQPGLDTYDLARLAVEEAKQSYTERIRYFDDNKYEKTRQNYQLLTAFQSALKNGELTFCLQPQCRISDGSIVGVEALARWFKQDGTSISPAEFVPFLETSGFITELDKYIWDKVLTWIRSLLDRNLTPVPVSVNVSQVDLLSMDVAAYLYALTERYHVPPRLLQVEITESAYAENFETITKTCEDLKNRGFNVFLDDFGSGYSSMNMLDKVNVDLIKLDMAFMRKESSMSRKGISIVESILGMSKALDLPIIVEGVETADQVSFLQHLGCRYAQGYYFYRPIRIEAFEALLADEHKLNLNGFAPRTVDFFHAKEFLNENLFTDSMLNHILGAVAYYTLEDQDLTITRHNEAFYHAIGDPQMDSRRIAIQNYVVPADHPFLYAALQKAEENTAGGGSCDIRFYKSDNSVFWFHMHFFHLSSENGRKLFYGQVQDITEQREQTIQFLEVLRRDSLITMCMDLDMNTIRYVTGENTLGQVDLPSMDLDVSVRQTAMNRIPDEQDRQAFTTFFSHERLKEAYRKAIYHETLTIRFRLRGEPEPVEFSTYYLRQSMDESLTVYAFTKLA